MRQIAPHLCAIIFEILVASETELLQQISSETASTRPFPDIFRETAVTLSIRNISHIFIGEMASCFYSDKNRTCPELELLVCKEQLADAGKSFLESGFVCQQTDKNEWIFLIPEADMVVFIHAATSAEMQIMVRG